MIEIGGVGTGEGENIYKLLCAFCSFCACGLHMQPDNSLKMNSDRTKENICLSAKEELNQDVD